MTTVLGLDVSMCSTGIVVLDDIGSLVESRIVKSVANDGTVARRMERIEMIVREVLKFVTDYSPKVICIEGYSMGSRAGQIIQIAELGGLLRYSICRQCNAVYEVAPKTLKKWATGKGNCEGKTPVVVAVMKRYGVSFDNDDLFDAYSLARMAYQIAGFEESATEQQREAIATVTGPKIKKPKRMSVPKNAPF